MESILTFFSKFAPLIFLFLFIGLLIGIHHLTQAKSEYRVANFGLEREIARQHSTKALVLLFLVGFFGIFELFLVLFLAPNLSASSSISTATLNPLGALSNTLSPEQSALLGTPSESNPIVSVATGCIPGQIMITSPLPGSEVKGKISLEGTANIPNFGFYKYEFSIQGSDVWSTVQAGNKVVNDGWLGDWDTSNIIPGDYLLRLVVTNNDGSAFPPCLIPIRISAP